MAIDGLDASGKDAQAVRLCAYLEAKGKSVLLRVHPSNDNFFGVEARRFLHSKGKRALCVCAVLHV